MERVRQTGIWIAAFCIVLVLLAIGYKKLAQPETKTKRGKGFYIAIIAGMALFPVYCWNREQSSAEGKIPEQKPQESQPPEMMCYDIMEPINLKIAGYKILAQRLSLLEKYYEEGKINQQTCKNTAIIVKKSLELLDGANQKDEDFDNYKKENNLTDADIEALKKKARELVEKIEKE